MDHFEQEREARKGHLEHEREAKGRYTGLYASLCTLGGTMVGYMPPVYPPYLRL